ncbi:SCO3242 family prenyltransferase [Streptomyces sp. Inha503]|uniref:SCO3242 family prenyltransferase n=1 Tax=Streptomyces sp. Inha503 TaxID=3383314 RepID=UPI0039A1F939
MPGDSLAGAVAAGHPSWGRGAVLASASVCLYWAGMALNDFADRNVDTRERPQRPIPSGRVTPAQALTVAGGLTGAGLALAGAAGGWRTLGVAVPLAGVVWVYDLRAKAHPVGGPAAMAAARALDVLLGAGVGRLRAAAPAAVVLGVHTAVVSALSRAEVAGASRGRLGATVAATAAVAALAARSGAPGAQKPATAALAMYLAYFAGAQARAAADRGRPHSVRQAVAAGITGMLPLQALCAARAGSSPVATGLLAGMPVARRLFRLVCPT